LPTTARAGTQGTARCTPQPGCRHRTAGHLAENHQHRIGAGAAGHRRGVPGGGAPPTPAHRPRCRACCLRKAMTSRTLLSLTVAALIALSAGLWLASQRSADPAPGSDLLYPDLRGELDAVTEVRLLGPTAQTNVTLKRLEDGWRVGERHDYRADTAKVRRLLLALADARVFEAKTANPEHYA